MYNSFTLSDQPPKLADFKAMAEDLRRSIQNLETQRDTHQAQVDDLNLQIAQLDLVLATLAPLVDGVRPDLEVVEGVTDVRLTDACREVMRAGPTYRTARGVRDVLVSSGYDLAQHKNPLASIHGVLKRLAESGEIEETEINGSTRYRRKSLKPLTGFSGVYDPMKTK